MLPSDLNIRSKDEEDTGSRSLGQEGSVQKSVNLAVPDELGKDNQQFEQSKDPRSG
jgi:hypothetical protein